MRNDRVADDLWAALLEIQLAAPTLDRAVHRALGEELRECCRSVLDTPPPGRILELMRRLAQSGTTAADGSQRQATAAAR